MAHAVWAPSAADKWLDGGCTAYPFATQHMQKEDTEDSKRGTLVHEALTRHLNGALPDPYDDDELDDDEAHNILRLGNFVRSLGPGRLMLETRAMFMEDTVWGTPDIWHLTPDETVLTVIDYKNGRVDVPVIGNPQLLVYIASIVNTFKIWPRWTRAVIYQPNSIAPVPRFKQHFYTMDDINEVAVRIHGALAGDRVFKAGTHCAYCPMFGKCDATQDLLKELAVALMHSPHEVPSENFALFAAMEKPIKDWFEAYKKNGLQRLQQGKAIPGMSMGATNKHRVWVDDAAVTDLLYARFGKRGVKPASPAQVEKLGASDVVLAHSMKPRGEPCLVFETDPRAASVARDVTQAFAGMKLP